MTDRIDLDDVDAPTDEDDDEPADWLSGDAAADRNDDGPAVTPRVPADDSDGPVGIPKEQGGDGGGDGGNGGSPTAREAAGTDGAAQDAPQPRHRADHGGDPGPDADMTTAFTWSAIQTLADPAAAVTDTKTWSDFVGLVGDVEAHVIGKFQRDQTVDLDFFNGSGTGPAERLARVDERSMFHADRMVVVGTPDDEWLAGQTDWEFVPLAEAAEGAGWDVESAK